MIRDISPTRLLETTLQGRISVPAREMHEVFARAGLNPRTLQRAAASHPHVVRFGRTHQVRYALTRQIRGVGDRCPLAPVSSDGRVERAGSLVALQNDHWTVLAHDGAFLPRYASLGSE